MWKSTVQPEWPQLTTWRMRIACWILKATDTHSEYVIFTAFPSQQWLQESASAWHYTYIHCLSCLVLNSVQHKITAGLVRFKKLSVIAEIHVRHLAENTICLIYVDKPFIGVWETSRYLSSKSYETFKCTLLQEVEFLTVTLYGRHNYHCTVN